MNELDVKINILKALRKVELLRAFSTSVLKGKLKNIS